jgi:hypothetical protein
LFCIIKVAQNGGRRLHCMFCTAWLCYASATNFYQQQLTTTKLQQFSNSLTPTAVIKSRLGPHRKHRSSVAMQLLLSDGMTYSNVAFAVIGTYSAENTIPLLLFTGRCLVTAYCCDSTVLSLSQYPTILRFSPAQCSVQ